MKIVFMGTPEFSVAPLEALVKAGHNVLAAFSQPDKPQGRGMKLRPTPVKRFAESAGIPVFQPARLSSQSLDALSAMEPDCIVVVAYGKLIPPSILQLPRYGCINAHASLLPKYRGAAPIQWALLGGETETGVSIMQMDETLDTGAVLLTECTPVFPTDTAGTLHDRLSLISAGALVRCLENIDSLKPVPQDDALATYAPMINKESGLIDWNKSAVEINRLIRAMDPWPSACAYTLDGTRLRIWASELQGQYAAGIPGSVATYKNGFPVISCGEGCLTLTELQADGGRRMSAAAYLTGHLISGFK